MSIEDIPSKGGADNAPKLRRNRQITMDIINGATLTFTAKKYRISVPTTRDAIKMAIRNCAPGYQDYPIKQLRLCREDVISFLRGDDPDTGEIDVEPLMKIEAAAKDLGLNGLATRRLVERLVQVKPKDLDIRNITPKDIEDLLTEKIVMTLSYMDDITFAKAGLKELSAALGVLIDRRQLMRGEPTQIMSNTDRKSMDELITKVMQVAQKRGLVVDLDKSEYQVN